MPIREIFNLKRGPYHSYDQSSLDYAYTAVKEDGMSVCGAARRFKVPESTLRDRVAGRINIDIITTGHPTLFDQEEEALLVEHIKSMADVGYGYTRSEIIKLATDYARDMGKKDNGTNVTKGWYYNFLKRWPEIHAIKPANLSELRAKAATEACVSNYFSELDKILTKYNLKDKPHFIYNVDEKGINTGGGKPPNIIAPMDKKAQVVTSERAQTVTVFGSGSASGSCIPPYLVFPGKCMLPELLKGATPGCDGTVSVKGTGYSNAEIFAHYVKRHFLKFIPNRDSDQPILLLYDGHKSHISISLIQWARENNIILFVLPPHCSHILQPMDVGCFSPFETLYQQETHKFMRQFSGQSLTRYDVCSLVCNVYEQALSPSNLRSSFKKTGIYPFSSTVVDASLIAPSRTFIGKSIIQNNTSQEKVECPSPDYHRDCRINLDFNPADSNGKKQSIQSGAKFLEKRGGDVLLQVNVAKKPRRSINKVVGGKAMMEDSVFDNVKHYVNEQSGKKGKGPSKCETKCRTSKSSNGSRLNNEEPIPSTSGLYKKSPKQPIEDDDDTDIDLYDSAKCCVCDLWEPVELKSKPYVEFIRWGYCSCGYCVHLRYCVPERVVRMGDTFKCPHCRA